MTVLQKRLEVFQVCDSTFPIGTFNHSFGLENYIVDGRVSTVGDLEEWLLSYYKGQYAFGEGLLLKLVYEALTDGDIPAIWEYDRLITVATVATETRNAGKLIAKQMLQVLALLVENDTLLDVYYTGIQEKRFFGHPAIVFGIYAHHMGMPLREAYALYGYSIGSTMVQNAVRSVPLGQKEGQVALHKIIGWLEGLYRQTQTLGVDYLGANFPGLELAQIRHETQIARLFMS